MKRKIAIVKVEDTIKSLEVLQMFQEANKIIEVKKIITPDIKEKLIKMGFKEAVIGCKDEHKITSKQVKIDFHGYDIAIVLSPIAISYGCGRRYRAMVIKVKE